MKKCLTIISVGGLPLITYASRGGGGVNTNAYKCVQGGRGGLNMTKNTHFVRRCIENATISETLKTMAPYSRYLKDQSSSILMKCD